MAKNDYVRPSNEWYDEFVPNAADFNRLDSRLTSSWNGDGGSAHTATKPVVIGNAGLNLTGAATLIQGGVSTARFSSGGGRIILGDNDFPILNTRTRTVLIPTWPFKQLDGHDPFVFSASSSETGIGGGGANPGNAQIQIPGTALMNGATLLSVLFKYRHTVGDAATAPEFAIIRYDSVGGRATPLSTTTAIGGTIGSFALGTIGFNSGNPQTALVTLDENNVIDTTQYRYVLTIADGGGPSWTLYMSALLTYGSITSMKFE